MKRSETFKDFALAFAKFQAEVSNPKMTRDNPYFKSKYAPLSEVTNVVRPILSKYGLSFIQNVSLVEEKAKITTLLLHESGEWLESSEMELPAYQKLKNGEKEFNAQGAGAAITYGRRYQLQAVLGIAADDDVDGEDQNNGTAQQPQFVPQNMIKTPSEATLKAQYQLVKGNLDGFQEYMDRMRNEKGYSDSYISQILITSAKEKKEQKELLPQ